MSPEVFQGDVRETLKTLPDDSVHCVVTSPPYWALRSYLPKDHPLKALEIGSEPTPEAFIAVMVQVFREVRRVLHPSGTCWVNIGDSYAANRTYQVPDGKWCDVGNDGGMTVPPGLKPKDLCLIPERLALALQADGWWVRSRIAWCKRSPMPESVTDRPTSAWEHIWLLSKSARYFYDAEAVKESSEGTWNGQERGTCKQTSAPKGVRSNVTFATTEAVSSRNLRNFWLLGPEPYSGPHYATFPSEIPKRAILAGTSARGCCPKCLAPWERVVENTEGYQRFVDSERERKAAKGMSMRNCVEGAGGISRGSSNESVSKQTRTTGWRPTCECDAGDPIPCTVLDPFGGSGTTAAVAIELGRKAILCELDPACLAQIERRTMVTPGLQLA